MFINKRFITFLILGIITGQTVFSQVIIEELSLGHNKAAFNHVFETQFGDDDQFTFSNFGFFYKYYKPEQQKFDELGVQVGLFRDIVANLEGGVAFHYNSIIGLQKKASLQYTFVREPFRIKIRPSLVRVNEQWNEMIFVNAQAEQPVTERWNLFGQLRFQMFWGAEVKNIRSFQRFRLGLSIENGIKLGLSADYDQFKAPEKREKTANYGLFLQKIF